MESCHLCILPGIPGLVQPHLLGEMTAFRAEPATLEGAFSHPSDARGSGHCGRVLFLGAVPPRGGQQPIVHEHEINQPTVDIPPQPTKLYKCILNPVLLGEPRNACGAPNTA